MDYKTLEERLQLWQHLHFTDFEYQYREDKWEIYATASNHQTLSKLFICRAVSAEQAYLLLKQYRAWLVKINLGRNQRLRGKIQRNVSVKVPGALEIRG